MARARELLRILSARRPPPAGLHHALTIADAGELVVAICLGPSEWRTFLLEDEDLATDPGELVIALEALLASAA